MRRSFYLPNYWELLLQQKTFCLSLTRFGANAVAPKEFELYDLTMSLVRNGVKLLKKEKLLLALHRLAVAAFVLYRLLVLWRGDNATANESSVQSTFSQSAQ